jgi:hypothetical protein
MLQLFAERKARGNIFRREPHFPLSAGEQRFLA